MPTKTLTFSQRNGLATLPSQLELGKISPGLRALIWRAAQDELLRHLTDDYVDETWRSFVRDYTVEVLEKIGTRITYLHDDHSNLIKSIVEGIQFHRVFDFLEFMISHPNITEQFAWEIRDAFEQGRCAYRIQDNIIIPIANEAMAEAVSRAFTVTDGGVAPGARSHLLNAGQELRNGNWPASVRESIHAVEAAAVQLAPENPTLGKALKAISQRGHLHGSLSAAFEKLYGYASDEKGVRHALVLEDAAQVDETDALFMFGACASFVTYLLARSK